MSSGSPPSLEVAGIKLTNLPLTAAAEYLARASASGRALDVHLINAYTVSLIDSLPDLHRVVVRGGLNFADGKPLTWAAKLLAHRRLHQVPGPDLFENVIAIGHGFGLRHYFLGSTEENLQMLLQQLRKRHPRATFVGAQSPPFRPLEPYEVASQDDRIRDSTANIVWVGLGTPKQDLEAARLARELGLTVVAIGAAFDFSAGALRRAPGWVTRIGLEWLFRWRMEPRRLWRRYTVGNAGFLLAVIKRRHARSS